MSGREEMGMKTAKRGLQVKCIEKEFESELLSELVTRYFDVKIQQVHVFVLAASKRSKTHHM